MRVITVNLGERSHAIYVGSGILAALGEKLKEGGVREAYIISNPRVFRLYGGALRSGLQSSGLRSASIIIPDGERYKNLATVSKIYDALVARQAERTATLIALGGGVVGDIVGFVAATFLRGVGLVQVPTTLVAQVDSAIGGKVGVNHPQGKNLIGAFYQPKLVWVDVATLRTLSDREFRAGLYEVIKYGVIRDARLFSELEREMPRVLARDLGLLEDIIARCCRIKAEVVSSDERESGLRMILNFGHTLGHALEAATAYRRLKHGEAVAWGMLAAAKLAARLGLAPEGVAARIARLVSRIGRLPPISAIPWAEVWQAMRLDKKVRDGKLNFVLPLKVGQVITYDQVPRRLLCQVFKEVANYRSQKPRIRSYPK